MSSNKGSGRSGHVQKNIIGKRESSQLYAARQQEKHHRSIKERLERQEDSAREARSNIEKHDELRKIQVACVELEEELEAKGASEEEIRRAVKALRTKLTSDNDKKDSEHREIYDYKPRFVPQ